MHIVPPILTNCLKYDEIDKLEKTKMNVRKYSKRYEAYQVFALGSFLALGMSMALKVTVLRRLP